MTELQRLFVGHQNQLLAALKSDRDSIDHAVLKGTSSEVHWRDMLSTHLPRRYRVATGIVVDYEGNKSEQIDVIIHDAHYCPLFRDEGGSSFVPAESVYAVLEAKQEINAEYLGDAADKAESVRALSRTSGPLIDRGEEQAPRELPRVLAGIIALTCGWKDGLETSFRENLVKHPDNRAIDLGCALDAGAFEVPVDRNFGDVEVTPANTALVSFFLALVRRLQALGTVPAIDWYEYERAFRA